MMRWWRCMVGNASGDDGGGKAWERSDLAPQRLRGVGTGRTNAGGCRRTRRRKTAKRERKK